MRVSPVRASLCLLFLLAGCASDLYDGYTPLPDAVQQPHREAMPHTDRNGALRSTYDPARSLFPLALSNALADYQQPGGRGFHAAFLADFNAVMADAAQPLEARLSSAEASRVQLLEKAKGENGQPLVHAALLDPSAALIVPLPRDPSAAVDQLPVSATQPVWALLPVHAKLDEHLPEPAEIRALAWTAVVSGASGLLWQGEDNYILRNAGLMGIGMQPRLDYGIRIGPTAPLVATPDAVAASRRLWDAVARINRRIARIAPALLQPDAGRPYSVAVRGPAATSRLRILMKPYEDGLLLIAVNAAPVSEDIRVALAFRRVARLDDARDVEQDAARGMFRDRLEAYGIQLYRITP